MLASVVAAACLLLQGQALDRIVVTTAPPLDSQRLADALRVYLGEFGISVDVAPPDQTDDLRQRIADARHLGESVRAVAVIRAEPGRPDEVAIELTDLATDKTLIATMKAARDEDLYRTLALKIQAILRATLSEARASLDPHSAVGRLVSENPPATTASPAPSSPPAPDGPLSLQAGYEALSLSASGIVLQGAALTATYSLRRALDLSLGTALLTSAHLSTGGVDAVASLLPVLFSVRARWTRQRVELAAGPVAEIGITNVTAFNGVTALNSPTVPVHSSRDILLAVGAEGELRLRIANPAWGYLRAGLLGVLDGPRYDIEGVPVLDTSGLELSLSAGVGLRFQ